MPPTSRADFAVAAAADHHLDAAFIGELRASSPDVDDAGGAVAVLSRQGAGQHVDAIGQAGVERLAEAADRLGDHDAIEPVLQVRVVASHVELAVRVADDARRAQQRLVQRRGVAERQLRDVGAIEAVDRAAGFGRQGVARIVETLARAFDLDALQLGGCRRR